MATLYDSKYNSQRKEALSRIENKQNVPSNTELGILGLTTYYSEETLFESLFDKILRIENLERKIQHISDSNKYFMPAQMDALDFLINHDRAILLAPTSFGKTLIVKELIFRTNPNSIVYIVPTNALAYELEKDFKNNTASFGDYQIFDKSSGMSLIDSSKKFFIGTQEKYLETKNEFDKVDLFVIDEAYKLEEPTIEQRGYKLSKSFLDSISSDQTRKIVLLCPVAELDGFGDYGFERYETRFNAVDKEFIDCGSDEVFYDKLNKLAKEEKTILYCETPNIINDSLEKIEKVGKPNQTLLNSLRNDFHPDWSVTKYAEKGIYVHHGQMPKYIQNKMINEFLKSDSGNLLVGTKSISEGINTPTKNIFIHPSTRVEKYKMLIKNTIGRAGRLGQIPIGHIYSVGNIDYLDNIDPKIILSVSKDEYSEVLEEIKDTSKIENFADSNNVSVEFLNQLIQETKLSMRSLSNIFSALKKNRNFDNFSTIVSIASDSFPNEYKAFGDSDYYFLDGLFKDYYLYDGHQVPLKTYDDRIVYFKRKSKQGNKLSNSGIVDGYMKMLYSSMDHYLLVVANIGKKIMESFPNWPFGDKVEKIIKGFLSKYYLKIYHVSNMNEYSESEQKILIALREYGFDFSDNLLINIGFIKEIESRLNTRYSTYDITNAIIKISSENGQYSIVCKKLVEKYL